MSNKTIPYNTTEVLELVDALNLQSGGKRLRTCLYSPSLFATKSGAENAFKQCDTYIWANESEFESYPAYPGNGDVTASVSEEDLSVALVDVRRIFGRW